MKAAGHISLFGVFSDLEISTTACLTNKRVQLAD